MMEIGLERGGVTGRIAGMGDMGVEEAGDGEAVVVDEGGIEEGDTKDSAWDYDVEGIREKNKTIQSSWLLRYIITFTFPAIMIPYWDGGYMGGNTWFALSVIGN